MDGGVIGNYRVLRRIGEGGMGTVYVAEHALIGRQAAIKVLLREMSWRQDLVTRFFNEARAATAVKHPGIVEIYDFGFHTDGSAYIVMEYLEGETLTARLRRGATLPEPRAAALCRQVAGALGAAHAKGIVHRDLKPDNIYIVRDPDIAGGERTKILDFGIAKLMVEDERGHSVTRTGAVMGTPPYMSPEQCRGAGAVDHRADLYALGCILFEMVCGRPPFLAEGSGEIIAQHIYATAPRPASLASVSPQLEQVILRALAKDPSQRFQSAAEMIAALHEPAATSVVSAATAPISPALPLPAAVIAIAPQVTTLSQAIISAPVASRMGHPRRRWLVPVIVAAALGSFALAIALGVRSGKRDDAPVAAAPESPPSRPPSTRGVATPGTPSPAPHTPPVASSSPVKVRGPVVAGPASPLPDTRAPAVAKPASPDTPAPAVAKPASPDTPAPAVAKPASPDTPAPAVAKPASPDARAPEKRTPSLRPAAATVAPAPVAPAPVAPAPVVPAPVVVKLTSEPAGADVYRMPQGARVGRTPLDYTVDAGGAPVTLMVKKQGFGDKRITVPTDHSSEHQVILGRIAAKPAPQAGSSDNVPGPGSADTAAPESSSLDPFEKLAPARRRN